MPRREKLIDRHPTHPKPNCHGIWLHSFDSLTVEVRGVQREFEGLVSIQVDEAGEPSIVEWHDYGAGCCTNMTEFRLGLGLNIDFVEGVEQSLDVLGIRRETGIRAEVQAALTPAVLEHWRAWWRDHGG
jgi:hypothetical protein